MSVLIIIFAGLFAVLFTSTANWLALIPWRRTGNQHWTERARLYHPARTAAASNLWTLPGVLTLFCFLVLPGHAPHWALLVFVTAAGAIVGTIPMDKEVFSRIETPELLRQTGMACITRFLTWFVLLTVAAVMPSEFNLQTLILFMVIGTAGIFWIQNGWIHLAQKFGWLLPPPERLQKLVHQTAAQMGVSFKQLWVIRLAFAQAYAIPGKRSLLFSQRLLELLSDEEIASICAHELSHLTEPRRCYLQRYVIWLAYLPWTLFKPMIHTFGILGFAALIFNTLLIFFVFRKISHRLETRADIKAGSREPDGGIYARALLRLHEDNLIPAVMAKPSATHPHLYDRLLKVGITPDFPRPLPAPGMAFHGVLLSTALGVEAAILLMRLTGN